MTDTDIPAGFEPHFRSSPVTDAWAPLYAKRLEKAVHMGLRLAKAHTNGRGLIHGGLIAALSDNAMGYSCAQATGWDTGKSLVISGEVLGWGKDSSGSYIQLKGADGLTVCCYPAPGAIHFPEFEAPAGAKVELVARYATFGTDDKVWTNVGLIRVQK